MNRVYFYLIMMFFIGTVSCSQNSPPMTVIPDQTNQALLQKRQYIKDFIKDEEIPAFAIGVIKDGKIVWQEAFGWSNFEMKVPATSETIFRIGSTSKSIIASGIQVAIDKNLLNLDDSVSSILGHNWNSSPHADNAKISQLLNMTAGLPHLWYYRWHDQSRGIKLTDDEIYSNFVFSFLPPGERYFYSNLSVAMAERVLEKTSGQTFEIYMQENLFTPLGMRATTSASTTDKSNEAISYDQENIPQYGFDFEPTGGGGFKSTLADLMAFSLFHLENTNMNLAKEEKAPNSGLYINGWGILGGGKNLALISDGQIMGGQSMIFLMPHRKMGIVALSNRITDRVEELVFSTATAIVPDYGSVFKETIEAYLQESEDRFSSFYPPSKNFIAEGFVNIGERNIAIKFIQTEGVGRLKLKGQKAITFGKAEKNRGSFIYTSNETILKLGEAFATGKISALILTQSRDKLVGILEFNPEAKDLTGGFPYNIELEITE